MNTDDVLAAVRAYGSALRNRAPHDVITRAHLTALHAIREAGGDITPQDLERYGSYNRECGNTALDWDQRGAAGGQAIRMMGYMEQTVRANQARR